MDEKIKDDKIFNSDVRGIKDFLAWKKLFERGYICVDANKQKDFVCPYHEHKCTFKSVLYFLKSENFEQELEDIYKEIEEENRRG